MLIRFRSHLVYWMLLIPANDELKRCFSSCKDGHVRLIKVVIKNGENSSKEIILCSCRVSIFCLCAEQLCLADARNTRGQLESDYKSFVMPLVEDHSPSFLLVRLDSIAHSGYDWLLISYTPDTAPVRQKMLYAATRATLKTDFGSGNIREEFHATTRVCHLFSLIMSVIFISICEIQDEVSYDGYMRWRHSKMTPGPMTEVEMELANVRSREVISS